MLWTHKIFLCGIIATSQGWLVYGCWLRIAGFRGGEPRLRVEAEDVCGLEAFTRAGVAKFCDDPQGGVGISHGAQCSHA